MSKLYTLVFLAAVLLATGCDNKDSGTDTGNGNGNNGGNGHEIGGRITLDHVVGLDQSGRLLSGEWITFHIRINNNTGSIITGSTNGFRLYSPGSARWEPITWDTASVGWDTLYDGGGGIFFNPYGVTGSGADTIGFGGFSLLRPGIPDGFDEVAFLISTKIDPQYVGETLCIDSSWYPPSNPWMWSTTGGTKTPTWDGPHCFRIVNP